MMIISFAWTSDAFTADRKTVTRRTWSKGYARRFRPGTICKAYSKQPQYGGKLIGYLEITSLQKENIKDMPDSDYEAEGFKYMKENGIKIWGMPADEAFKHWKLSGDDFWVVRFKKISI